MRKYIRDVMLMMVSYMTGMALRQAIVVITLNWDLMYIDNGDHTLERKSHGITSVFRSNPPEPNLQ